MNFTKALPTEPGFYLWRQSDKFAPSLCTVDHVDSGVMRCAMAGARVDDTVRVLGGEWCRLVPAQDSKKQTAAVLGELYGRGGFDHWWDGIEEDDQNDIREAIAGAIERVSQ